MHNAVDGNWATWGSYGACTVTCGGGSQTRTRTCSDPAPQHGGTTCSGSSSSHQTCNTHNCPSKQKCMSPVIFLILIMGLTYNTFWPISAVHVFTANVNTLTCFQLTVVGRPGDPMAPALWPVGEEHKSEVEPVPTPPPSIWGPTVWVVVRRHRVVAPRTVRVS